MNARRFTVLTVSVLLVGSGTAALSAGDALAAKQAARTYGVVAQTQGQCMQRYENLARNLAGQRIVSSLPCGRWTSGSSLWSGSISVVS